MGRSPERRRPGARDRDGARAHPPSGRRGPSAAPHRGGRDRNRGGIAITSPARTLLDLAAAGSTVTRSELEERFLALCDRHRIPRPTVNTRIPGMEVDFGWPRSRLVDEVDGYAWHRSPTTFEADRARDVTLVLAGYRVLRFTCEQVTRRPAR